MWKKIGFVILIALATLGVLFIILMVIPDDSDEGGQEVEEIMEKQAEEEVITQLGDLLDETEGASDEEEYEEEEEEEEPEENLSASGSADAVAVNIPESALSKGVLSFQTTTLDGKVVTEDIFSDADITIVSIWGTYCPNCIEEMPDYAKLYQALPGNINLIGLLNDVYDGIDSNVSEAKEILSDAGADFMNLRTSDDLYDIVSSLQYVPSSFLVDSEGHIIGGVMDPSDYTNTVKELSKYVELE